MDNLILHLMNNGFDLTFIPFGEYTEVEVYDNKGNIVIKDFGEDMEKAFYNSIIKLLKGVIL